MINYNGSQIRFFMKFNPKSKLLKMVKERTGQITNICREGPSQRN